MALLSKMSVGRKLLRQVTEKSKIYQNSGKDGPFPSISATRFIQNRYLFPDITHEENRPVFGKKRCGPGIGDRNGKTEPALRLIPELAISIETEPDLLIVHDHFFFFQCAHGVLLFGFKDRNGNTETLVGSGGPALFERSGKSVRLGARPPKGQENRSGIHDRRGIAGIEGFVRSWVTG